MGNRETKKHNKKIKINISSNMEEMKVSKILSVIQSTNLKRSPRMQKERTKDENNKRW